MGRFPRDCGRGLRELKSECVLEGWGRVKYMMEPASVSPLGQNLTPRSGGAEAQA